jgi:small subunit ribosomal protein S20
MPRNWHTNIVQN